MNVQEHSNRRTARDITKWNAQVVEYSSIEKFLEITSLQAGLHSIHCDGQIIDFFYEDAGGDRVAVFFHGAVKESLVPDLKLPVFSGQNLDLEMPVDRIMISDASLANDKRMVLGWYSGNLDCDLPRRIDQVLRKIKELKAYKRILLLGGSQGGFAALRASYRLKGSVALIWNPQTNIKRFFKTERVDNLGKFCFKSSDYDSIPSNISRSRNFDLTRLYSVPQRESYVFLMQNLEDTMHVNEHAIPLVNAVNPKAAPLDLGVNHVSSNFICAMGDWVGGHSLIDRNALTKVAGRILRHEGETADLFSEGSFDDLIPQSYFENQIESPRSVQTAIQSRIFVQSAKDKITRTELTAKEREQVSQVLKAAYPSWYLEFGSGPVGSEAIKLGFERMTSIDTNLDRVQKFKAIHFKDRQNETTKIQCLKIDVGNADHTGYPKGPAPRKTALSYCRAPWWVNKDGPELRPSVVYSHGVFAVSGCLYASLELKKAPDQAAHTVFLLRSHHNLEALLPMLRQFFVIGEVIDKLYTMKLKSEIDPILLLRAFNDSIKSAL